MRAGSRRSCRSSTPSSRARSPGRSRRRVSWPTPTGSRRATGIAALAPGRPPQEALDQLRTLGGGTVALVGHEPHLSSLAALLVAGDPAPLFTFRKGGACLLEIGDAPRPGGARLRWLATAKLLRMLGAREGKR